MTLEVESKQIGRTQLTCLDENLHVGGYGSAMTGGKFKYRDERKRYQE